MKKSLLKIAGLQAFVGLMLFSGSSQGIMPPQDPTQINPYDYVGQLHNQILDSIIKNKDLISKAKDQDSPILLAQLTAKGFCSADSFIVKEITTSADCVNKSEKITLASLISYSENNTINEGTKDEIIKEIISTPQFKNLTDSQQVLMIAVYEALPEDESQVDKAEEQLLGIEQKALGLPEKEAFAVLSSISVAKYTTKYWAEQLAMGSESPWLSGKTQALNSKAYRAWPPRWLRNIFAILKADVQGAVDGAEAARALGVEAAWGAIVGAVAYSGSEAFN